MAVPWAGSRAGSRHSRGGPGAMPHMFSVVKDSGHCNEDKVAPTYVILAGGEAAWVLVLSEERRW